MSDFQVAVLILAVVLFGASAFFAMAETSLSRIDKFRAEALAEEGKRGSSALARLVESPEHFSGYLNSLLLLALASQLIWVTAVAYLFLQFLSGFWFALAVFIEIGFGYVVAEATPKTLAVQHPQRAALFVAPIVFSLGRILPMRFLTRPLIWLVNLLVPGPGLREGPFVYEQQILALADSAAAAKAIESGEHDLIHSVIEFGTTIAREVMVPRTDMIAVGEDWTVAQTLDLAIVKGLSRLPVYKTESDDITGMVFTKDLMRAMREGHEERTVHELRRDAKYVPETKRVAQLLTEMQEEKVHMAIVLDEHGTVVGVVTLEDLVEEVVGEIQDEYDVEEFPQIEEIGPNEWRVDARVPIDEVNEEDAIDLPRGDWDTVGGLLINAFERVPNRGESIDIDNYRIWVEQTAGRRVTRVRIKLVQPTPASENETVP